MKMLLLILLVALLAAPVDAGRRLDSRTVDSPLQLDGRLDEPCYGQAEPSGGFVQFHPVNGGRAALETDVYVFHDSRCLYIAFRCHDPEPGRIKADVTPFGGYENNDEVQVLLDPFADRRGYVEFRVNPRGVRAGQETIWEAAARVDGRGWCAEIAIPFKSLRFPRGGGAWGINLGRHVFRLNETDYWAPVRRDQEAVLASTFGELAGLEQARGGRNLEIFPYAALRGSRAPDSREERLALGLDLKFGITSNLTLDLTAAPDYSQVESDPFFAQTSPYEYRLSENRLFYAENAALFQTAFSLFYSRRVTHPDLAFKVTGKEGGTSVGLLFARNGAPGGDRFHGVLRVKQDLFRLSWVGAIYTSLEGAGGWNRNAGMDFQLRLGARYTVSGFAALAFNQGQAGGQNGIFRLGVSERRARGLQWSAVAERVEPDVNVRAGYVAERDYQKVWLLPNYCFLWEGKALEKLQLVSSLMRTTSIRTAQVTCEGLELIANLYFRNQARIWANCIVSRIRPRVLDAQDNLAWNPEMFPQSGPGLGAEWTGNRRLQAGFNAFTFTGEVYTDDFRSARAGRTASLSAWMALKPSPGWEWKWNAELVRQTAADRTILRSWTLLSASARWQATRKLSAGAVFQYDSLLSRIGLDLLLLFEPAPVSRLSLSFKSLSEERFRPLQPLARTLSLKASYLIRL